MTVPDSRVTPPGSLLPTLDDIRRARERIAGTVVRTPLIRLDVDAPVELFLKLENLQPIGSFKLRGALNAMRAMPRDALARGVYTSSAGNMAQGVAWGARELGVPCTVLVPDTAARTKIEAVTRLGARVVTMSHADWWTTLVEHGQPGREGAFIHPVANRDVIAGAGTIALELVEELDAFDAVYVPYGGGGLSCGIAAALGALRPGVPVYGCEVETAAPLTASLSADSPVTIDHRPSWITGIGGRGLLAEMWPMARDILAGARVSTVAAIADALRLMVSRARVVAEGAGAAPVAAALADASANRSGPSRAVAIVSGGNIDLDVLAGILTSS